MQHTHTSVYTRITCVIRYACICYLYACVSECVRVSMKIIPFYPRWICIIRVFNGESGHMCTYSCMYTCVYVSAYVNMRMYTNTDSIYA